MRAPPTTRGRSDSRLDSHRPIAFSALYANRGNKEGWQRMIGTARNTAIMNAVQAPTKKQDDLERSGMVAGLRV